MPGTDVKESQKAKIRRYFATTIPRPTQKEVADWYRRKYKRDIHQSTVSRCLTPENEYLDDPQTPFKRLRARIPQWPKLEEYLLKWIKRIEATGGTLTEKDILERGRVIWNKIKGIDDVDPKFSSGWLSRFKARNTMKLRKVYGEKGSVDPKAHEEMISIRELCKEYPRENIYNMDESALYWKAASTVTISTESIIGRKPNRQRLTFTLCCNADGSDRCEIFLIGKGKSQQPRIIKDEFLEETRCFWRNNDNAWMTGKLMEVWLPRFYNHVGDRFVLLLLDNFSGHTKGVKDCPPPPNVRIQFLPPNSTSIFQPLDQGVIRVTKAHYRRSLLDFCLAFWDQDEQPFKEITYCDAVRWLSQAWYEGLKSSTIAHCFQKSTLFDSPDLAQGNLSLDSQTSLPIAPNVEDAVNSTMSYFLEESTSGENSFTSSVSDADRTLCDSFYDSDSEPFELFNAEQSVLEGATYDIESSFASHEVAGAGPCESGEAPGTICGEIFLDIQDKFARRGLEDFIEQDELFEPQYERDIAKELDDTE
ncbi:hypothetical protein OXX59_008515, partial [Metschnikowia pulcherrima]